MKHFVCAAFALAIVFSLSAGSVSAHHSFAATYLEGQTQTIEGKVVQFLFRNPHSFLHVEAPDEKGTMQVWNIEWGGGGLLGRQGVNRDTLKPGDLVIVVGQHFATGGGFGYARRRSRLDRPAGRLAESRDDQHETRVLEKKRSTV